MTAGEDATFIFIQDCHAPVTTKGRAEKPRALPAKIAVCPIEIDGVAFVFPILATALVVGKEYPVGLGAYLDGSGYLAMPEPLLVERLIRNQQAIPLPMPHVDGRVVVVIFEVISSQQSAIIRYYTGA